MLYMFKVEQYLLNASPDDSKEIHFFPSFWPKYIIIVLYFFVMVYSQFHNLSYICYFICYSSHESIYLAKS